MPVLKLRRNLSSPLTCEDMDQNWEATLDRSLHQGTQLANTISNLKSTVQGYDFILALQTCCTNLTNQLEDLQDSIFGDGELSTFINNLRNELLQDIAEVQTDLNVLKNRVTATETNIATINPTLISLGNSITGLASSKANIDSPIFTGVPKAPTAISGASSDQIATVGYVNNVASGIIAGVPSSIPVGSVIPYSGASISDPNYVLANGQAISRTTYASYFTLVGIIYGTGDGINTFNVPNLQQRIPVGAGSGYTLGATGGAATHTLTTNEMPTHSHTGTHSHTVNDPMHTHVGVDTYMTNPSGDHPGGIVGNSSFGSSPVNIVYHSSTGITINSASVTTSDQGSSQAHNNMQPYIVLNYIVKVK
jgi:microcystin-dependent protein